MEAVRAIVFYANPWELEDDKTGQRKKGLTIEYIMTQSLEPVQNDNGSMGYQHCKQSLPYDKKAQIKEVPGVYELVYGFGVSKGKPTMVLQDVKYVCDMSGVTA